MNKLTIWFKKVRLGKVVMAATASHSLRPILIPYGV